jgi:hypothetical protein
MIVLLLLSSSTSSLSLVTATISIISSPLYNLLYRCVTHFILIARNPVRITISEQYANRFNSWTYLPDSKQEGRKKKKTKTSVCEKSLFAHHVGGRWLGEMAIDHYSGFREAMTTLSQDTSVGSGPGHALGGRVLGLTYEADILTSPVTAYRQVIDFLHLATHADRPPSAKHRKGMACPLGMLLVNLEELWCSLYRFEQQQLGRKQGQSGTGTGVETGAGSSILLWMAADTDNTAMTFDRMMSSWREVSEQLWEGEAGGHIAECSLADIDRLNAQTPGIITSVDSSPGGWMSQEQRQGQRQRQGQGQGERQRGVCGVGGETSWCRGVPAVPSDRPELCLLTARRAGCGGMTLKDGHCYLHANNSDFRVEACSHGSWYQSVW